MNLTVMTAPFLIRRYRSLDRDACVALFDSNIPEFFLPEERPFFTSFLDSLSCPYIIIENEAGIVGCGGIGPRSDTEHILCWFAVEAQKRRQGIGLILLRVLLALANRTPGVTRVGAKTSRRVAPFLEHEGLCILSDIHNYVRPAVYMACDLDAAHRAAIEERLSLTLAEGHRLEDEVLPAR